MRLVRHVMRLQPVLCAAVLGVAVAPVVLAAAPALAQSGAPGPSKLEFIKDNDLAAIDVNGADYSADFPYIGCGVGTGPPYASTYAPCETGDNTPIYASWVALRHDNVDKLIAPGTKILFDIENWPFTPAAEQANPALYISKAIGTAHLNGEHIIVTANFGSTATDNTLYADAAADGADVVAIQTQGADNDPSAYFSDSHTAVRAVRKAAPHVQIWLGLATDAGGTPADPANLITDYDQTYGMGQGYWLNANQWAKGPAGGCENVGCPAIAQEFLTGIGVTSS